MHLVVEFLQESDLLLQGLHFSLQIQTSKRGVVDILRARHAAQNVRDFP